MAGAILEARRRSIPVLLDGFVVAASAAVIARLATDGLQHCLAGHVSAEPGHRRLLERLELAPLLDLGLRLGEGSGAAVALGRSEEHTSELQSLMRISYAVFCLHKKITRTN